MNPPEPYPELLRELVTLFQPRLAAHLPAEVADRVAQELADDVGATYSGCQIYIPKRDRHRRAMRDHAIAEAYNGRNIAALAHQYRLTATQIYAILAQQRRTRQGSMF